MRRTCIAVSVLALGLAGCGSGPEPEPVGPRTVRAEVFHRESGARTRTFSGVVRAGIESQLSFKVPGTVETIAVRVGDTVDAGDLVARLDDTDYRIAVEDARAALARQEAAARNARTTFLRTESLYENDNASLADLESARAADESARAAVRSAEQALERAERQLEYTVLRAPIAGAISAVQADEGENVQGGTPIALLTAGDRPEVEVDVPEMLIADVREGQSVRVRVEAVGDRRLAATVTEVGVAAVGGASAFPVRVRLDAVADRVLPGMAAEVELTVDRGDRAVLVLPPAAVAEDVDGRHAFVVREDADGTLRVERADVVVGDLTSRGLEVLEGIEDGAMVVTAGVDRLVDGERVRLWQPAGSTR